MRKELEPFLITLVCLLSRLRSFPIPPLLSPVKKSSCKLFSLAADTVQLFASVSSDLIPCVFFRSEQCQW